MPGSQASSPAGHISGGDPSAATGALGPVPARRDTRVACRHPPSRGGAGAGGEPRLCRDGGGAEEGAHTPFGPGRAAAQDVRPGGVRVLEVWRQAAGVGVREGSRRGESDSGAPGVAHGECAPGPCARAAPERVVLKLKPPQPAKRARHLPRPSWEGGWGRRVPQSGCAASPPAWHTAHMSPSAVVLGPPWPLCTSPLPQPQRPLSCLYACAYAYAYAFGPNLVRQEPIWSPKMLHASSLGVGSTQGGGQTLLEAAGIEPAASVSLAATRG
ncbi:hypothetical protein ATI61_103763 [Archangium gephyra]|uniref:Uncharacterized protein n=1 Tax=Archangium gephyra TaxID=48 RepID=A0ABX9K8J8_9BACT|nr:hypothetical protein ATI61_103763 [Archangium gephyra]